MKIGLVTTPFKEDEIKKFEYIAIHKKRKWLKNMNCDYIIHLNENYAYNDLQARDYIRKNGSKYVTDDISIYYYLKDKYGKKHSFILIKGDDENIENIVKSCDVVFLLIFDILEAFHTLPKEKFEKIQNVFSLPNVFPPYAYQKLINHKNLYYDYLSQHDITVVPTLYISSQDFLNDPQTCVEKVLSMSRGDMNSFIGKPIYGQESIDFQLFDEYTRSNHIHKYLERISALYKGCVFQPFIKSLSEDGEYRVFYIGKKYVYTIKTKFDSTRTYITEKYVTLDNDKKLKDVLKFTNKVFQILPHLEVGGKEVDKLLTRIDVNCCYDGKYFVSEIEFVPSLYINTVDDLFIDKQLGDQMMKISNQIYQTPVKHENKRQWFVLCILFLFLILFVVILQ